jgi:hypothetical protein
MVGNKLEISIWIPMGLVAGVKIIVFRLLKTEFLIVASIKIVNFASQAMDIIFILVKEDSGKVKSSLRNYEC